MRRREGSDCRRLPRARHAEDEPGEALPTGYYRPPPPPSGSICFSVRAHGVHLDSVVGCVAFSACLQVPAGGFGSGVCI